ncbi:MAG: hypothetical protein DMG57_42100 [Acidobacteria bacterium]|nr:MAG: hypothetical protein DMG57_42100 [Acidobacteriota bacterium]
MAIRDLLVYGANRGSQTEAPITQIGWLDLCANDFVERDPVLTPNPTNLQLAAQVIRTWDVYNPRELAYAMTRMYTILTEILPGDDPTVVTLRDRIGMDNLAVDGLTLPEFVAIAFALFAHGNAVGKEGMNRVVFEAASFFRYFPKAQPLLDRFLRGRALTLEQLAVKLAADGPRNYERFLADAKSKTVLDAALPVFRQHPLLRIDDARVVILDLQFLTDLVTTGIYWLVFDALPGKRRETFRELWGRCFELYVTELLGHFYPAGAHILSADIEFSGGQIDALLDFGNDVFVLEIKSSLLTEPAKRGGDLQILAADIERKFISNERGAPKAVLQLARAAEAVLRGEVRTAIQPRRIYPVLITDEPGCECLGFTHISTRDSAARSNRRACDLSQSCRSTSARNFCPTVRPMCFPGWTSAKRGSMAQKSRSGRCIRKSMISATPAKSPCAATISYSIVSRRSTEPSSGLTAWTQPFRGPRPPPDARFPRPTIAPGSRHLPLRSNWCAGLGRCSLVLVGSKAGLVRAA